ncbi:MAG: baseplate J/gp47 family protein [Acidobacteria bacterium]|nr:baseplate J/gp47 family protein [Acidobacteriota bacterium]MBI3428100.1 baseplate J/gp47 family protein [Acidobacteriota bacterium]
MPILLPTIDDRRYRDLRDEVLARIPAHTPEYTNFNESDPGVTLIEAFAFLTENLLYRSNQIPERNRRKFLQLLGVPLQPATAARGLVTLNNERGSLAAVTLNHGLEINAGAVPFRTTLGLEVLPIEAQCFYKRAFTGDADRRQQLRAYYDQLYASFLLNPLQSELELYESVPFPQPGNAGLNLGQDTLDGSLWIALLTRVSDRPATNDDAGRQALRDEVRHQIANHTLSLGLVPVLAEAARQLLPGGPANPETQPLFAWEIPAPNFQKLNARVLHDVLTQPGIVQITLPADLGKWDALEPLEAGVGELPPPLDDTQLSDRLITWIRLRVEGPAQVKLLWAGINATLADQRAEVRNEQLPKGMGQPDQVIQLARQPVIPGSVRLSVTPTTQTREDVWAEIEDLTAAGPEIIAPDPRLQPGAPLPRNTPSQVYRLDAEAGRLTFGDGFRGARLPRDATVRADYAYSVGRAGNVNVGAIKTGAALPAGFKVNNPVRTWGGADAEQVSAGEKQIARFLQHRERLVTAEDFDTIARRTPGIEIGRLEVLPAYNPELGSNEPGDAPGAVTLLVIPQNDPANPEAPRPDRLFLNTLCAWLDQRRLVTTEVYLRGPDYRDIWVSVGINVVAGERSLAEVTQAVEQEIKRALAPLPAPAARECAEAFAGWPLRKAVNALELMAIVSRVPGVMLVNELLLGDRTLDNLPQLNLTGLQLPRLAGLSVTLGRAVPLAQLRNGTGGGTDTGTTGRPRRLPVPIAATQCK